jgi:hypothetical protein
MSANKTHDLLVGSNLGLPQVVPVASASAVRCSSSVTESDIAEYLMEYAVFDC